ELFKTPWQFYRTGVDCDVLICSSGQFEPSSAKLVLLYGVEQKRFDQENGIEGASKRSQRVLTYGRKQLPLYEQSLTFKITGFDLVIDESTNESAAIKFDLP